jgi:hypothetical protein
MPESNKRFFGLWLRGVIAFKLLIYVAFMQDLDLQSELGGTAAAKQ